MSEAPTFNPMQEAQARADINRQVFEQYMERDSVANGAEEHAQGYQDLTDYMGSRPSEDAKGKLHDPETGAFMSKEDAGAVYSGGELSEHDEYAEMTPVQLAKLSAEAEVRGDKTMQSSIDDALQEKILAMPVSDEVKSSDGTDRKSERENVLDRVLKAREAHIKTLTGAAPEANAENAPIEENAPVEEVAENAPVEEVEEQHVADAETAEEDAPVEEVAEEYDDVELAETEVVEKPAKAAKPVANPFDAAPTTAPTAGMEAPKTETKASPFDTPPAVPAAELPKVNPFDAAPSEASERVVRTYLNAEGKPLAGFDELNNELARKVAEGDDTNWDNLVQTLRDAVKNDSNKRYESQLKPQGDTVEDRIAAFEKYASKKYNELMLKKNGGRVDIPPIVQQTPDVVLPTDTPEKKKRWSKAKVIGASLLAGLLSVGWFAGMDQDNPKAATPAAEAPAENPFNGGDSTETPQDTRTADRAAREAGETVEVPAAPEHVFTVEVPYTEGAPTAWSWAESLGVTDVPGFLKEVMGDDWQDIARHMKIGDKISVSDEEIAQFSK
jgi:hypothetical protein